MYIVRSYFCGRKTICGYDSGYLWSWGESGGKRHYIQYLLYMVLLKKKEKIYFIFRQRVREAERGGEKHQRAVASHVPPTGDLARNPAMCPDWESNRQPCGLQASTQSTESQQPERFLFFNCYRNLAYFL